MSRLLNLFIGLLFMSLSMSSLAKYTEFKPLIEPEQTTPAQVDGEGFVSLHKIISAAPLVARINFVGDEALAMEMMFAVKAAESGKLIWLQQRRTSQYMFEVSHSSLQFDVKRDQLKAYRVIRPVLVADLTEPVPASTVIPAKRMTATPPASTASVAVTAGDCQVTRTAKQTFWQVAKQFAKQQNMSVYDGVVSLYYHNLTAFSEHNIQRLVARSLACPSAQQLAWWQTQNRSEQVYQALLKGTSYQEAINLNELPK